MTEHSTNLEILKKNIRSYRDFPKPGVLFRDIFSVLQVPEAFCALHELLCEHIDQLNNVQGVVALESRGFLIAPIIALKLKVPFLPIRKKGKLPGQITSVAYTLEYGTDILEVQTDGIKQGQHYLIVDDLLATGGSLGAACQLINKLGGHVIECLVIMELTNLKGRLRVHAPIHSLLKY